MKQQQQQHQQLEQRENPVLHMVRTVRGTAPRIAAACSINREAVWNWHQVPAKHVLNIEALLKIPRHLIRPDIYEPPLLSLTKQNQRLNWRWNRKNRNNGR